MYYKHIDHFLAKLDSLWRLDNMIDTNEAKISIKLQKMNSVLILM